jgi:hypothetical protein
MRLEIGAGTYTSVGFFSGFYFSFGGLARPTKRQEAGGVHFQGGSPTDCEASHTRVQRQGCTDRRHREA